MAEILFEALVSSPETLGTGSAVLPKLRVEGYEVATHGLAHLPLLTVVATGTVTTALIGTGICVLPGFRAFANDTDGGTYNEYEGWGLAYLPAVQASGTNVATPIPQSGSGIATLPLLTTVSAGATHLVGTGAASLRITAIGIEAAGNFGIAVLPPLRTVGYQVTPVVTNYATLMQEPGYLYTYVSNDIPSQTVSIVSSLGLSSAAQPKTVNVLRDSILAAETLSPRRERFADLTDEVAYNEALALAWHLALSQDIALAGTASTNLNKLGAIVDTLAAMGVVSNRLDALAAVSSVLAINALIATGWRMDAIATVAFQDALQAQLTAVTALVDSATFAGVPDPSIRITAIMSDALALAEAQSTSLQAFESLSDEVLFYATLRIGDAEYAGWVMNGGAASEYRNYPFNGFLYFAGDKKYYGTSDEGLYLLEGSTDGGDPINAWVKTALMDFGTGKNKSIPDVYVAFIGGNQMVLKVITTNRNGTQTEHHYTSAVPAGTTLHNGRIKVGRGLESRYWQFALNNVAGADFEIDETSWRVLVLDKRI